MTLRRAVLLAVLGLSIVVLVVALNWSPTQEQATDPATGLNVIVLAVDGLDWFLLGEYMEEGSLLHLNRIFRTAVVGEVEADSPALPHVGWTIVARGRGLEEDESYMIDEESRLFGVSPEVVRLVNQMGGTAVAIGWPGAWPVSEDKPAIVAPYTPEATAHPASLSPALFGEAPGQASEADFDEAIASAVRANLESLETAFADEIHEGPCEDPIADEAVAAVKWGYLADSITLDIAGSAIAEREPDLALVYLGGLDTAMHRFLAPAMPDYFGGGEEVSDVCSDIVPNYHRFVDDAVGRLLRLMDENSILLILSAYGTHPSVDAPPATGGHGLGPPGVLIARGSHLAGRGQTLSLTTADVAPTILAALGMPIPEGMSGSVMAEILPLGTLEECPPTFTTEGAEPNRSSNVPEACVRMEALVRERLSSLRASTTP